MLERPAPLPLAAVMDEVAARSRRRTCRARLATLMIALLAAGVASATLSATGSGGRGSGTEVPALQPALSRPE